PTFDSVIYTGDHDASPESLSSRATNLFGVKLLRSPKVVHLRSRKWIEEATYPRFTMIGQSFGSVYLSWEALCAHTPEYYFDTSGYAFTYPVARIFGCKVLCYIHYPTISLDMLSRVHARKSMYNNDASIAKSLLLSQCKVIYYKVFSWMYGIVGSSSHLAMVNSTWTESHIRKIWRMPAAGIKRVYPPCDTSSLQVLPLRRPLDPAKIISVAQFRPEKMHPLQLEAFALARKKMDGDTQQRPKLQFVGSCRNEADEKRLQYLKDRAKELQLENDVEFYKNVAYSELVSLLGGATVGIHSMVDEHFGISVVEYMASGAISIAHNSGGPKMDILVDEGGRRTGFLAETVQDYADAIVEVVAMPEVDRLEISRAARERAIGQFSEQRFYQDFKAAVRPLMS
ncbi:hypothetical protein M569_12841, partial [Genlisea aurea]